MITLQQFESIKQKHGGYASWAVWADAGTTPKSNMGEMSMFDLTSNPALLDTLKNNVIMVALNFSRPIPNPEPFVNFHDKKSSANDFKIRYAFQNTEYYGAYMTDIIKNFPEVDSKAVVKCLKANPDKIKENVGMFREELRDLNSNTPIILAFGNVAHKIMKENMRSDEYSCLIKLTHYSHQIGKEKYKKNVLNQIYKALA